MKQIIIISFIFLILLSACDLSTSTTSSQPAPTVPQARISTPTMAINATPTNTLTPEPTATKEIRQYPRTTIENYVDAEPIPIDDLYNGNYFSFLQTLSQPFDESKIVKQVSCHKANDDDIYWGGFGENDDLSNSETAPLRRGTIVNYVIVDNIFIGPNQLGSRPWLILPVEFYNPKDPGNSIWVVFAQGKSANFNDQQWLDQFLQPWSTGYTLAISDRYKYTDSPDSQEDPIIKRSFQEHPDLSQRLERFAETCDPSFISAPGILLGTGPLTKQ